jgi:phospholipid/cholesterol/gamma-HCH transport system substrate-binding protein
LAVDARKTLDEINRTMRSFGKNPEQVIFGAKPSVPEYGR